MHQVIPLMFSVHWIGSAETDRLKSGAMISRVVPMKSLFVLLLCFVSFVVFFLVLFNICIICKKRRKRTNNKKWQIYTIHLFLFLLNTNTSIICTQVGTIAASASTHYTGIKLLLKLNAQRMNIPTKSYAYTT